MPTQRPGALTAAAILCIIYGSLGAMSGVCGIAGMALQGAGGKNLLAGNDPAQAEMQKKMEEALERKLPGHAAFDLSYALLSLLTAIGLLIAGIGLLGVRPWSRMLAMTSAIAAMIPLILHALYLIVFVIPIMGEVAQVVQDALPQKGPGPQPAQVIGVVKAVMIGIMVMLAVFKVLWVIYLAVVMMLLSRPNIRAAFASVAPADYGDKGGLQEKEMPTGYEDDKGWDQYQRP
jgi:hypothetical protein